MSWVHIVWPMLAGATLILALIHALIWARQRTMPEHLAFAVAAASLATLTLLEFRALDALTPERLASLIRWMHVPIAALVIALVTFLRLSFGKRFFSVALVAASLRIVALALNFSTGENLNFAVVSAVGRVTWVGDAVVSYPIGAANPWVIVAQLSNLLLALYVVMLLVTAIRHGERQSRKNAIIICGGWLIFIALMVAAAVAMTFSADRTPFIGTPSFIFVIAAMSYQLTYDLFEAERLARQLHAAEIASLVDQIELSERRKQVTHLSRVTMLFELTGALAHELNQPLAAILSNAQAAQRMLGRDPNDLAEVHAILGDIVANDRRAGEIIRRLRAMMRKDSESRQPTDLNDAIRESLKLLEQELRNRDITITTILAPELPLVEADVIQIEQVMLNLLINACEAMADCEQRQVTVRSEAGASHVRVAIRDRGPGVPEARRAHIFEPFQTTKVTGLGLGLSICRSIVEAHGGRLWLEEGDAPGACFCFELPVAS